MIVNGRAIVGGGRGRWNQMGSRSDLLDDDGEIGKGSQRGLSAGHRMLLFGISLSA